MDIGRGLLATVCVMGGLLAFGMIWALSAPDGGQGGVAEQSARTITFSSLGAPTATLQRTPRPTHAARAMATALVPDAPTPTSAMPHTTASVTAATITATVSVSIVTAATVSAATTRPTHSTTTRPQRVATTRAALADVTSTTATGGLTAATAPAPAITVPTVAVPTVVPVTVPATVPAITLPTVTVPTDQSADAPPNTDLPMSTTAPLPTARREKLTRYAVNAKDRQPAIVVPVLDGSVGVTLADAVPSPGSSVVVVDDHNHTMRAVVISVDERQQLALLELGSPHAQAAVPGAAPDEGDVVYTVTSKRGQPASVGVTVNDVTQLVTSDCPDSTPVVDADHRLVGFCRNDAGVVVLAGVQRSSEMARDVAMWRTARTATTTATSTSPAPPPGTSPATLPEVPELPTNAPGSVTEPPPPATIAA